MWSGLFPPQIHQNCDFHYKMGVLFTFWLQILTQAFALFLSLFSCVCMCWRLYVWCLTFVLMFCCLLSAGCWLWQSSRPNLERPVSPGLDPPCTMYVWTLIIDYSMPVALVDGGEFIWSFWGVLGLLCTLYCSGSVFIVDPWHSVLSVVAW